MNFETAFTSGLVTVSLQSLFARASQSGFVGAYVRRMHSRLRAWRHVTCTSISIRQLVFDSEWLSTNGLVVAHTAR